WSAVPCHRFGIAAPRCSLVENSTKAVTRHRTPKFYSGSLIMSAKTQKRKYKAPVESGFWTERWTFVLGIGVLALILILFYAGYQLRSSPTGPYRNEYQGKIVDKWAKYHETEQGSRPSFTFMIESEDGQRFPVVVGSEIYQRGQVGMEIKKSGLGGIELMEEATRAPSH